MRRFLRTVWVSMAVSTLGVACGPAGARLDDGGPDTAARRPLDAPEAPVFRIPHVAHFGYWGSGLDGLPDAIDATAGSTTLVFVRGAAGSPELADKLDRSRRHGQRAILFVQNVFFPWQDSHLVPDPDGAWRAFRAATAGWDDVVLGYYLFDEPYWNNAASGWSAAPVLELEASLERAAALVKASRPAAPVLLSFAWAEVTPGLRLPPSADWFAVNCYRAFQPSGACDDRATVELTEALRARLGPGQRLFLTSDAYWGSAPTAADEDAVLERIGLLQRYAADHSEVVALTPFLYQTVPGEHLWGAESMPRVRELYRRVGRVLLGAAEPTATSTACEGRDFVRRNGAGAVTEVWPDAPPPYCAAPGVCVPSGATTVACEGGRDSVRRDSCGGEVERWADAPSPYCP